MPKGKTVFFVMIGTFYLGSAFIAGWIVSSNFPSFTKVSQMGKEISAQPGNSQIAEIEYEPVIREMTSDGLNRDNTGSMQDLLREAVSEPDPIMQMMQLAQEMLGLNAQNVRDAISILEEMPPGQSRMRQLNLLMHAWGAFDGPAAVNYAINELDGRGGRWAANTAISS